MPKSVEEIATDSMPSVAAQVDEDLAARILAYPANTLRYWRRIGKGPVYVKHGKHVRYPKAGLTEFMTQNAVRPQAAQEGT